MRTLLLTAALWLAPALALAVPMQLANSGRIEDAAGVGLSGSQSLTFTLYTDAAGAGPLWSETITVDFTDGAYAATLGLQSPLDEQLLDQHPLFLGLSVNGGPDMAPRYEVASAPYAILAETAANAIGGVVDVTEVRVNGTAVIDASGAWQGAAPAPADLGCADAQIMTWNAAAGAWACATPAEGGVDTYTGTPASGITDPIIAAWNEAFGWGDHGEAGYVTTEADPVFSVHPAAAVTLAHLARWDTAHGWGDHGLAGYLTAEIDPTFAASVAAGIVSADLVRWNEAHAWGDHAAAGYIGAEIDPTFAASVAAGIVSADLVRWNEAHAWGDHAAAGYVSGADPRLTDARDPLPDSPDYIQNQTAAAQPASFSIAGDGLFGGNVGVGTDAPAYALHVTDTAFVRDLHLQDDHVAVHRLGQQTEADMVALLLPFGALNHLSGQLVGRRNSGHTHSAVADLLVNMGSAAHAAEGDGYRVSGSLNYQSTQARDLRLVKATYNGVDYVGVRINTLSNYRFSTGIWFTGQVRGQGAHRLTLVPTADLAAVAPLNSFHSTNHVIGSNTWIEGSISKLSGSFDIPHPDLAKRTDGYRLRHAFVEGPTRGENLYRYEVEVVGGAAEIALPDYFAHLNENPQVWVSPSRNFGRAYGEVNAALTHLSVRADTDGTYNVLLIGTRQDEFARDFFDADGVEYVPRAD